MVCYSKPLNIDGSTIFLERLVYRLYLLYFIFSVQCLCEDGYPFADLLEKTFFMGICDYLVFHTASISALTVEYLNHAGVGLLWWC